MNRCISSALWLGFSVSFLTGSLASAVQEVATSRSSDGSVEVTSDPYLEKWREPLQLTLPAPTRSVLLAGNIQPAQWLQENGLYDARLLQQGRQTLVQFGMSAEQWADQQSNLCQQNGVMSCDAGACQAIQMQAEVVNARSSEAIKARIIKTPPSVESVPDVGSDSGICRTGLVLDLANSESGAGINLNLDFSQQNLSNVDSTAKETSTDLYGQAEPTYAAADFLLDIQPNFADGATLSAGSLPADTSDYTLLAGEGCSAVEVPLSSVAPAYVPRLVVALVNGNAAALGAGYGMVLLSENKLPSTGETLAVYTSVSQTLEQVLPLLRLDNNFLTVDRENIYSTTAVTTNRYSDPFATLNYGPKHSGARALHKSSDGEGQTIAVIDTGIALDHPDLAGRVEYKDLTGKGWDADAHGTAVAGIIAAAADNALGSYGVAPKAKILGLKACQPKTPGGLSARCWTSTLVQALDVAIARDAEIINMSLAGPPNSVLARYVALAVKQNRLVIAGAGNGGMHALPAFPAALPGVLAVTAIDSRNLRFKDANQGDYIDVAAPGVDIVTISPDGSYPSSSGTSWAAAHVSGVAALLKPLMPLSSAADIAHVLRSSGRDLGRPGKDPLFGHGLLDVCAAATAVTAEAVTCEQAEVHYVQR